MSDLYHDVYEPSPPSTDEIEEASSEQLGSLEPPSTAAPSLEIVPRQTVEPARIADGVLRRLHPAWITNARLRGLISSAILIALLGAVAVAVGFSFGHWLAVAVGWIGLALLLLARALFWPPLAWRHYAYSVAPRGLRIRRGVLVRSALSVPKTRVQHTDVSQGPIQRHFGIASLTVHTAGTQYAAVSLPGLPYGTALAIRDYLIDELSDDEGEDGDGV